MYPVYDDSGELICIADSKEQLHRLLGADFDCTTGGATQIGPQRAMPASPAQIHAQVKQSNRALEALDAAGEQRETTDEGHCGFCYDGPPSKANPDDPESFGCEDRQVVAACSHSQAYWSQRMRGLYCPACERVIQGIKAVQAGEAPLR